MCRPIAIGKKTEAEIGKNARTSPEWADLLSCTRFPHSFFFSSPPPSYFLFTVFFHLPVILTSRNHENKPKDTTNKKGGQNLVVLRVLPSPYGSGIFPVPRLKGCLSLI
jgi:hypothetical protein